MLVRNAVVLDNSSVVLVENLHRAVHDSFVFVGGCLAVVGNWLAVVGNTLVVVDNPLAVVGKSLAVVGN